MDSGARPPRTTRLPKYRFPELLEDALGGECVGVGKPEPLPHAVKPRGVDRACNQGQSPQTPGASTAPMHTCELEDLHERGFRGSLPLLHSETL